MRFTCSSEVVDVAIEACVVAGWTGRDRAAINHHIQELAAIGVTPPSAVPLYYWVASSLLTQATEIQVVGGNTSGEVEPLVVRADGRTWLGLASDHTDRTLETHSVALSKQVCCKPCAGEVWDFDTVADRLDTIALRSWIREDGEWTLYQQGTLASLRPLPELMAGAGLDETGGPAAMLCGTFAVVSGGVRPAAAFRMEMHDPVLNRTIRHQYATLALPVVA